MRRYLGQAAVFRLAWEQDSELLDGFCLREDGLLFIPEGADDRRKACLEHLMDLAGQGDAAARSVFRKIGRHLGVLCLETDNLLCPGTSDRYLYGRMILNETCFREIREGFAEVSPCVRLIPGDESLANTPLMRQLAATKSFSVAQFGQAVGAVYYAA